MNFDDEEQHFNLDILMHEQLILHPRAKEEKEEQKPAPKFPMGRIKKNKRGKLILKKKKESKRPEHKDNDNSEGKVYDCHHPMCEKVFLDRNSYRKHLITHGEKQVLSLIIKFSLSVKQKIAGKDF